MKEKHQKPVYSHDDFSNSARESEELLPAPSLHRPKVTRKSYSFGHVAALYLGNIALFALAVFLWVTRLPTDPGLAVYSPANKAVEYIDRQHFRGALFNKTEYMGYPTADGKTDRLWEDLYDFGISTVTREEAEKLTIPTLPIPGTHHYLIQLSVWHELHCLNDLRKILYPEVYPGLDSIQFPNGTINREHTMFLHWDHCIDSLRQSIMCHADVAPMSFRVNIPAAFGLFPRIATTHTCKNFTKIQDWAKEHQAGEWNYNLTKVQAQEIIEASGAENNQPEEDIQFLYEFFPGNKWFKYWQEHDVEKKEGKER